MTKTISKNRSNSRYADRIGRPAVTPITRTKLVSKAEEWFLAALEEDKKSCSAFTNMIAATFNAGIYFSNCKAEIKYGEWEQWVEAIITERSYPISRRTIYRYIEFAEDVIAYAATQNPGITNRDKLIAAARKLTLHSPKALVSVLRERKQLRQFGEYDPVRYQQKRDEPAEQLTFAFEPLTDRLKPLAIYRNEPERVDPWLKTLSLSSVAKLKSDLEAAAAVVNHFLSRNSASANSAI